MKPVHTRNSAHLAELKKNPAALIDRAEDEPVVILHHNRPAAYLVPAHSWEKIMEKLDDLELLHVANERLKDSDKAIGINLDEL